MKIRLEDKVERENDKKLRSLVPSLATGTGIYITSVGYHNDEYDLMLLGLMLSLVGTYELGKIFYNTFKESKKEKPKT